jgi:uncharacterized membrane protein
MEEKITNGTPATGASTHIGNGRLGEAGRIAPLIAGAALSLWSLSRRSWATAAAGAVGGYIAYRALSRARPDRVSVVVGQTINKPIEEVYRFCRDPQNWPVFMRHLQSGKATNLNPDSSDLGSQEGGFNQWGWEIEQERENEIVSWRSAEGSPFYARGTARFQRAPGNRGTELRIAVYYETPSGPLGRGVALALGRDPEQQAREGLRALKALLEAGEIPTTVGQPHGRRGPTGKLKKVMYRETQLTAPRAA